MADVSNKDSLSFNYSIKSQPFIILLNVSRQKEPILRSISNIHLNIFHSYQKHISFQFENFFTFSFVALRERERKNYTDPNNINT